MSLQRIDRRLMACDTLFLSRHSRRHTEFCAIALYIPFVTLKCLSIGTPNTTTFPFVPIKNSGYQVSQYLSTL